MEPENIFVPAGELVEGVEADLVLNTNLHVTNKNIKTLDDYFSSDIHPIQEESFECYGCKRTWSSTEHYPRTSLLCGHTVHTICSMISDSDDQNVCPHNCTYNGWGMVHTIANNIRQAATDKVDEVVEELMKTVAYKQDFKVLKESIRKVAVFFRETSNEYKNVKKTIIHKHIHSINEIQRDLNSSLKAVGTGVNAKQLRSSIMVYRRRARLFHLKYNVSFRNLYTRKLIKVNSTLRWVLERHRNLYSRWRYSIQIYPGKKVWKDPIA